jgi:hypothetical protein
LKARVGNLERILSYETGKRDYIGPPVVTLLNAIYEEDFLGDAGCSPAYDAPASRRLPDPQ